MTIRISHYRCFVPKQYSVFFYVLCGRREESTFSAETNCFLMFSRRIVRLIEWKFGRNVTRHWRLLTTYYVQGKRPYLQMSMMERNILNEKRHLGKLPVLRIPCITAQESILSWSKREQVGLWTGSFTKICFLNKYLKRH